MTETESVGLLLPELDRPCPHCTTDEAKDEREAACVAWNEAETAAYDKFVAEYSKTNQWGQFEAWEQSPERRELGYCPEPPGVGCVECDHTSRKLTDAGRELLAFMKRWSKH